MGRFRDAWTAFTTKPEPVVDKTPRGVRIVLADGRTVTPILVQSPLNEDQYVAYGPESIGKFSDFRLVADRLLPGVEVRLALMATHEGTSDRPYYVFAPMHDFVEWAAHVNHDVLNRQNGHQNGGEVNKT